MPDYFSKGDNLGYGSKVGDYRVDGLIGHILTGDPAWIQQEIEKEQLSNAISERKRLGMQRAKEQGIHVGRPADSDEEILAKYPDIADAIRRGMGLRAIAREQGVSRNTVRKVKAALGI